MGIVDYGLASPVSGLFWPVSDCGVLPSRVNRVKA